MAGLTPAGFVARTFTEIFDGLVDGIRAVFGPSVTTRAQSVLGQIFGLFSDRLAELWEVAAEVATQRDPDQAVGAALDALCALTGTYRLAAEPSLVTLTACGTPGTILGPGRLVTSPTTSILWFTLDLGTITALSAWAPLTVYADGDRVTNWGECYEVVAGGGGTSAGAGGPTGQGLTIADGTVTWQWIGTGTGAIDIPARSYDTGPLPGVARDLTTITSPVGGWSTVTNLLDAVEGRDIETDAALRLRRVVELGAQASSPLDAIRARLIRPTSESGAGCTYARVLENTTDATVDTIPPHAVEALVVGGTAQDIVDVLFASVAAGIATSGGSSGTATDSLGGTHTINYTVPSPISIYFVVTLTYSSSLYPATGDADVKAAIVADLESRLTVGDDVFASDAYPGAQSIAGVLRVTSVTIGTAPAPVGSSVTIGTRERPAFDTSRITVTSTPGAR